MTIVEQPDLEISPADVLRRLRLTGRAFTARPAETMVTALLGELQRERLVEPRASYGCTAVRSADARRLDLDDGSTLVLQRPVAQAARAQQVLAAAWSLGPGIAQAVAQRFRDRRGLQALVLDEIASLLVMRLGERLFAELRHEFAARGLGIGRALAPGDGALALGAQAAVLQLAGADRIGVGLAAGGVMSPLKTATALALVGPRIRRPRRDRSCRDCRSRAGCRLRSDHEAGAVHDVLACG
ncbi:MAG: hypothetical protein IT486_05885 [Gammaproteobacteria bacterium]|nr:hypothetical protein [Gammaproteobacteria bacterium]